VFIRKPFIGILRLVAATARPVAGMLRNEW